MGSSSGADVGMSKPPQTSFSARLYFPAGQLTGNPSAPCSHQQHCSFGSCRKIPLNRGCMQIVQRSPCPVQAGSAWELIFLFLGRKQKPTRKKKRKKKRKKPKKPPGVQRVFHQSLKARNPLSPLGDDQS